MRTPSWLRAAVRVADAPWAVAAGIRTLLAVGAVAAVGAAAGHLTSVAVAFFGAACAVAFIGQAVFRTQAVAVAAQALGAVTGLGIAALTAGAPPDDVVLVLIATAVALVSGSIGAVGRQTTAFATMLVIGLAFGQFGRLGLPWAWQSLCYLAGSAVVLLAAVPAWVRHPRARERAAVADVFDAAAALLAVCGTARVAAARDRLAAASGAARAAVYDHRFRRRGPGSARRRRLDAAMDAADATSLAAAGIARSGEPVPPAVVEAVTLVGREVRRDERPGEPAPRPMDAPTARPEFGELHRALMLTTAAASPDRHLLYLPTIRDRVRAGARRIVARTSIQAGLRLALCIGVATAATVLSRQENHSYWLVLTVAVVVRPEYASIFVRTANRGLGTVVGALLAAVLLATFGPGWPVAICAALAMGFAVAAAPKSYAISVVGITCAALLSGSIGTVDPATPAIRLLDTLAGCAIALLFGYLLWPGRRRLPPGVDLARAASAAHAYARLAVLPPAQRPRDYPLVRLDAYRLAHATRAAATAALAEPPPACDLAAAALPRTLAIEDAVDDVTRLALRADAGSAVAPADVEALTLRLETLGTQPMPA